MDAYLFDFGNVLAAFDHGRFCRRLAAEAGETTPEEIHRFVFEGDANARFETGELDGEGFHATLTDGLRLAVPLARLRELWCDIFRENAGMAALLEGLQGRARRLLVSNTNPWHMESVRGRFGVLRHIDAFVLSYEVGARKPDERIYRAALAAAGVAPERCLYFDDLEPCVQAARRMGIPSVMFRYDAPASSDSR